MEYYFVFRHFPEAAADSRANITHHGNEFAVQHAVDYCTEVISPVGKMRSVQKRVRVE